MFGKLKRKLGKTKITVSYNSDNTYTRCKKAIMRIHHDAIIETGDDHEVGLEDAVINPMALDGLCDRLEY